MGRTYFRRYPWRGKYWIRQPLFRASKRCRRETGKAIWRHHHPCWRAWLGNSREAVQSIAGWIERPSCFVLLHTGAHCKTWPGWFLRRLWSHQNQCGFVLEIPISQARRWRRRTRPVLSNQCAKCIHYAWRHRQRSIFSQIISKRTDPTAYYR